MSKQCVNCPGAVDHTTAECPVWRDKRSADMARIVEAGEKLYNELRQWQATESDPDSQEAMQAWRELQQDARGVQASSHPELIALDKQCRDDVARALGLTPTAEHDFAWSYLLDRVKRLKADTAGRANDARTVECKLVVSTEPLRQVLNALVNAPHLIRELQATREPAELFGDNPINVLIAEFNAQQVRHKPHCLLLDPEEPEAHCTCGADGGGE